MRYSTPATVSGDTNGAQRGELRVDSDNVFEPDRGLYVLATDRTEAVGLWLREVDARKLAEKLAERYGLVLLADPKVGDEVTLLPGARCSGGSINVGTSTRFKVMFEADGDGDLSVRALDGNHEGRDFYVLAQYLRSALAILPKPEAPAEPAKPAFEPGQAVTLTEAHAGVPAGANALVRGQATAGTGWRLLVSVRGTGMNKVVPESKLAPLVRAEAAGPAEPKVGDIFELARPYRLADGEECYLSRHGTTRVRIASLPDGDGDYVVEALNGEEPGGRGYVGRAHFEGLTPNADRPWAVGDEAIVTEDSPHFAILFRGDRVRITQVHSQSEITVRLVAGRGRADTTWAVSAGKLRRP